MRMNIQGYDSLSFDGKPIDDRVNRKAYAILFDRLGAARVVGVKDLHMFWIKSGEANAGTSRVLGFRYVAAKRIVHCRMIIGLTSKSAVVRNKAFVRDMARLTDEILGRIEDKLDADLAKVRATVQRDFEKLAAKASSAGRAS